jgi:HPt (histidine-containing phosphotransfer) domain-containing protein
MLAKCLPGLAAVPAGAGSLAEDAMVLDLKLVQEVCGNSPEMLREFVHTIRESFRTQIPEMHRALESQHIHAIGQAGHKMKSSASIIGAQSLLAACTRIETVASNSDVTELLALRKLFDQEAQRVVDALAALDTA